MTSLFDACVSFFRCGAKTPENRRIGIEKEYFLYSNQGKRLSYPLIAKILEHFCQEGYTPVLENDLLIGARFSSNDGKTLSIEPGGQFELGGRPCVNLHDSKKELEAFDRTLDSILEKIGGFKWDIGCDPISTSDMLSWMPKKRYEIMREYMPKKGTHGLDMMRRTATLQVNLDYTSEENMMHMMCILNHITPILSGLCAASPFFEGRPSNYKSLRSHIWQHTDPDRSGLLPLALDGSLTFDAYTQYLFQVPMYFLKRGDTYIPASGDHFPAFIKDQRKYTLNHQEIIPSFDDVLLHMTTAFPEIRLKSFIEVRCMDSSPIAFAGAAMCVGLLYDDHALECALNIVRSWDVQDTIKRYTRIPKYGLNDEEWSIAFEIFDIAQKGLVSRNLGEEVYLEPLNDIIGSKKTYADRLIENGFQGPIH